MYAKIYKRMVRAMLLAGKYWELNFWYFRNGIHRHLLHTYTYIFIHTHTHTEIAERILTTVSRVVSSSYF